MKNNLILLIPHYNDIRGLKKSLKSIGKSEEIDVLIVDDGSRIENRIVEKEIRSIFFAKGDIFFKYLKNNLGIEHALNEGLKIIIQKNYYYTARLDCGDECKKNRFKKQKKFLENNPEFGLVGSNVTFFDLNNKRLFSLRLPSSDRKIRKKMYLNAMLIHPTIMFPNFILKKTGMYPTNYKAAEDYAFFFNIIKHYKVANINECLVDCEINPNGISSVQRKMQAKNRINIILKNFYFGYYPILGLFRSMILFILPMNVLLFLKKRFK